MVRVMGSNVSGLSSRVSLPVLGLGLGLFIGGVFRFGFLFWGSLTLTLNLTPPPKGKNKIHKVL